MKQPEHNQCQATWSGLKIDIQGKMLPSAFLTEIGYYKKHKYRALIATLCKCGNLINALENLEQEILKNARPAHIFLQEKWEKEFL